MGLDKIALIEYKIEKSKETIKAAQLLIENNLLNHAENRIYYAIFYIVSALAVKYDFSTSKHKQLLGWFNRNFVYTNKISLDLSDIYKDAFDNRQESDYEDYKTFELDEVKIHFEKMMYFIEVIEKLIRGNDNLTDKTK